MTLQEAVKQLDRIVSRPLSFHEKEALFNRLVLREAEGSGDFGHAGRPGQVGGSLTGKKSHNYDYEKAPNENLAGGYWRHNSVKGKIFNSLEAAKGDWIKVSSLKQEHGAGLKAGEIGIDRKIAAIKRWGQNTGRWSVEISGDQVRMFMANRQSAIKPQSEEKLIKSENRAEKLVKDYEALKTKYGYPIPVERSKELFDSYYKDSGVSKESKESFELAVTNWTGSVNLKSAQTLRGVAMAYYGRNAVDEHTNGDVNHLTSSGFKQESKKIQDAAMAAKAYAAAYARKENIKILYRGVSGTLANEIRNSIEKYGNAEVAVNSLSSWSESKSVARHFGQIVLKSKVDPDNIWASYSATPWLFSSSSKEKEFIVGHHKPYEKFKKEDVIL